MFTRIMRTLLPASLVATMLFSAGCHLIFPYRSVKIEQHIPFFCQAQIARTIAGTSEELTEEWRLWAWPTDQNGDNTVNATDAALYCAAKAADYVDDAMSPHFTWTVRNMQVDGASTASPFLDKREAMDCGGVAGPPAFGAPLGADIVWIDPPASRASVWVAGTTNDGGYVQKYVEVEKAVLRFAARTGLPNSGGYVAGAEHLRFFDVFVELEDFELGGVDFSNWYLQSVGTVIAGATGGGTSVGPSYTVGSGDAKLYMYMVGTQDGESDHTSDCFVSNSMASYAAASVNQGPAGPGLTFALDATAAALGQPFDLKVSLSSPLGTKFSAHQPAITAYGPLSPTPAPVTLTATVSDHDNDLAAGRVYWFENFEAANETYLGKGNPLANVKLSKGDHAVTVVVYDQRGAYSTETFTVQVANVAPTTVDNAYFGTEDTTLVVAKAEGVLVNDSDPNGDALWAEIVSEPAHDAAFYLLGDGSFFYLGEANFCGFDSFTYRAHDGEAAGNTATVALAISCVNDAPAAVSDAYSTDEDTPLSVAAPGVLGNDGDADGDALSALLVSGVSHGALSLGADGSFVYTPAANTFGADAFSYRATDGTLDSGVAQVAVTVVEVPPAQEAARIGNTVDGLLASGTINGGQAQSLKTKLAGIATQIDAGKINVACNLLNAFVNEVKSLVATGVLTAQEAQPLLDKAANLAAELGCVGAAAAPAEADAPFRLYLSIVSG